MCHRTLVPDVVDARSPGNRPPTARGSLCIGSACPLWVPMVEIEPTEHELGDAGIAPEWHAVGDSDDPVDTNDLKPMGLGLCADNLRATPWPDPADGGSDADR